MIVRDINGRLFVKSNNISNYLSKKEWATNYREHIMLLYAMIQRDISKMYPHINWDTETILAFIDLLYENSSGEVTPFA